MEWNRRADRRSHGRKPGPFEEPAAILVRFASEHNPVGALGIVGVKFEEVDAFLVFTMFH